MHSIFFQKKVYHMYVWFSKCTSHYFLINGFILWAFKTYYSWVQLFHTLCNRCIGGTEEPMHFVGVLIFISPRKGVPSTATKERCPIHAHHRDVSQWIMSMQIWHVHSIERRRHCSWGCGGSLRHGWKLVAAFSVGFPLWTCVFCKMQSIREIYQQTSSKLS